MTLLEILKGAKRHLAHSFDADGKQHYICFAINDFVLSQELTEELCIVCREAKKLIEAELVKLAPRFSSMHFSSNHAKIVLGLGSDSGKVTLDQIQEARHKFLDQLITELEQT